MFVERLTPEIVGDFIKLYFGVCGLREQGSICLDNNRWRGSVYNPQDAFDFSANYYLADFHTSDNINATNWTKYLHGYFGEEYRQAFLAYADNKYFGVKHEEN